MEKKTIRISVDKYETYKRLAKQKDISIDMAIWDHIDSLLERAGKQSETISDLEALLNAAEEELEIKERIVDNMEIQARNPVFVKTCEEPVNIEIPTYLDTSKKSYTKDYRYGAEYNHLCDMVSRVNHF